MAQISTGKSMVAGMASLIVGAVSLGIQDSRPAVLAMPILLTLQVYWLSPGLKDGVLYGNVFRKQTRRVIEISLLLYFTCLYGWTVSGAYIHHFLYFISTLFSLQDSKLGRTIRSDPVGNEWHDSCAARADFMGICPSKSKSQRTPSDTPCCSGHFAYFSGLQWWGTNRLASLARLSRDCF